MSVPYVVAIGVGGCCERLAGLCRFGEMIVLEGDSIVVEALLQHLGMRPVRRDGQAVHRVVSGVTDAARHGETSAAMPETASHRATGRLLLYQSITSEPVAAHTP
jgi:hypothetical protein